MACFKPLQSVYTVGDDGKKSIRFSNVNARLFYGSNGLITDENSLSLPCSKCIGCKLERSRQWAVRMMHEAQLYDSNSFITLTFAPDFLPRNGSLDVRHMQLFMKRLRKRFDDRKIRNFYCGEYGDRLGRPHYHGAMFNLDFSDKEYWKTVNGCKYYRSSILEEVWPFGHSVVGDLTFESAAYIARYCTKKITGSMAQEHYQRVLPDGEVVRLKPEFCGMSRRPGIGRGWYDKYGMSDIFPRDECVTRGMVCKPPRYYDTLLEASNPEMFLDIKKRRDERREDSVEDNIYSRLLVKEKCQNARMKQLVRSLEAVYA